MGNTALLSILFAHNAPTSFVQIDQQLLQERWPLVEWYQPQRHFNPTHLWQAVRRSGLVFCWFASWHSLWPVLFAHWLGKPSVVVVGGYDTANVPEAGYGSQRGGLRRLVARTVIHNATHLITHSHSTKQEAIANAGADPHKITVIYLGLPTATNDFPAQRQPIALTVGGVWHENLRRKGLLPFVQTATYLPEVKFIHAGKWYDDSIELLRQQAGSNVEFQGFVPDEKLQMLYQTAAVYVQPSLHEGFGMSVAEAMLAGCVPVVTRRGSLPEVVGDCGFYIDDPTPKNLAQAIQQALIAPYALRQRAREHILAHFPMQKRSAAIQRLINELIMS